MIFTNGAVDAAQVVIAEATRLICQDFPNDSPEELERGLKRAFSSVNSSQRAVLNAEALRQSYAAFHK